MAGKAINIGLSVKQQARLQRQLESGQYENLNEVFDDALRLMNERDAVCEWLREEMRASLADKHRPSPIDEVFKRERARMHCTAKSRQASRMRSR